MQISRLNDQNIDLLSHIKSFWHSIKEPLINQLVFIFQRLAFGILVLLFIIFLSYVGLDMATGTSFSEAIQNAIPESSEYIRRLLPGDLGLTTAGSETLIPRPVSEVIQERLPRSLGLLGASLLFASVVGVSLGIISAQSRARSPLGILLITLVGISVPSFFAAFLLQWAVTSLTRQMGHPLLPVGGFGWDKHIILPMLVLATQPVARITRMTFISIRQNLGEDYVRTANGKGLRSSYILYAHIIRNIAITVLTTIGISLRFSLSSLPVVELFFGWTGVGVTLLKGISEQDTNLVIGLTLCLGAFFILVNLILELSYRLIDPRLSGMPEYIAVQEKAGMIGMFRKIWNGIIDFFLDNPLTDFIKHRKSQNQSSWKESIAEINQNKTVEYDKNSKSMNGAWRAVFKNFPMIIGSVMVLSLLSLLIFGPALAPNNPFNTQGLIMIDGQLTPPPFHPSETYPWGTDALGRGILSLVLSGAQQTLTLALLAVGARLLLGFFLGAIAGWNKDSLIDRLIQGAAEIISAFPTLLMAMILILALGIRKGMPTFIIALCFVGWGEVMQFVRGEVISIRPKPFIESAVATGARSMRILTRHVFPILFSALTSIAALEMGSVLMLLGELGFISIFIGGGTLIALPTMTMLYSDVPEWGALLSNIRYLVRSYPWVGFYPMLAFFISILSFNLLGEGIRRMVNEGNPLLNKIINRYTLMLTIVAVLGYNWLSANSGSMPFFQEQARQFNESQAYQHLEHLTDPKLQGRALGSDGQDLAALYAALAFEEMGLQPGGSNHTYFQIRKRGFERLLSEPILLMNDQDTVFEYGSDFAAYPGRNITSGMAQSSLRFIALGEDADVSSRGIGTYPELHRADFSGEILLTLSDREAYYLASVPKDGMLVITNQEDLLGKRFTLSGRSNKSFTFTGFEKGKETPSIWLSEQTANQMLENTGKTVADLRKEAEDHSHKQVYDFPIPTQVTMAVEGALEERWQVKNVVGLWPGSVSFDMCDDCPAKKLIVVMAQYDNPPVGPEGIYPGAVDNASGLAVLLETVRVMKETQYQPYKSFLFVAYSGEGLDGGEPVIETDVSKILQANPSFSNFEVEAIVVLRGLGSSSGNNLELSAEGSLRLTEIFEKAARQLGVRTVRSSDPVDISMIYDESGAYTKRGQEAPVMRLYWEGWDATSLTANDTLTAVSQAHLREAGQTLSLSLMMMGRDQAE